MLIEVAEDVLRKALTATDKDHEYAVEALRHLAWSIRRNHHLVFFPSLDQNMINQFNGILNSNEIIAMQHSFSKKRDLRRIRGLLRLYVVVTFTHPTGRAGNVINIKPDRNNHIDLFEKCYLLTENVLDAEFYQYFAMAYQKMNRIDECVFKTNYYPLQGGGATTKNVYILECKYEKHFCIAILDSDKKWPNYVGYGSTATGFEDAYHDYLRSNPTPLTCHYYVMQQANEIENLIPLDVLRCYSSPSQKNVLATYPTILNWLDIKKGLEFKLLYNNVAFREWRAALPIALNWTQLATIRSASTDEDDYKTRVMAAGLQEFVKNWESNILDMVLHPDTRHKGKYDLKKVDMNRLLPPQRHEWEEIGALVFSWCCCFVRKLY